MRLLFDVQDCNKIALSLPCCVVQEGDSTQWLWWKIYWRSKYGAYVCRRFWRF